MGKLGVAGNLKFETLLQVEAGGKEIEEGLAVG